MEAGQSCGGPGGKTPSLKIFHPCIVKTLRKAKRHFLPLSQILHDGCKTVQAGPCQPSTGIASLLCRQGNTMQNRTRPYTVRQILKTMCYGFFHLVPYLANFSVLKIRFHRFSNKIQTPASSQNLGELLLWSGFVQMEPGLSLQCHRPPLDNAHN